MNAQQYFYYGLESYYKGDLEGAITLFSEAIKANNKYSYAYNYRGLARFYLGKLNFAFDDFNQAIELNPKDESAYNNRGLLFLQFEHYELAINNFDTAIILNEGFNSAYINKAIAYIYLKQFDIAINFLSILIERSDDPEAYFFRAKAYVEKGNLNKALKDINRAIRIDDKNNKYILYKENIYYLMGKYKNVLKEYSNSAIDESCRFFFYICTVKSLCALFEYDFDGALDNIKLVYKYDIINNSIDYKDIENKIIKIKEDFFNDFLTAEELKNNIKKIKEMLEPVIFRRLNNYIWNKIFKKENIKNSSYIAEINKEIQELNEKLKILAEIKREVINNRKNFIFFIESRINLEKYILNINQELIKSNSDKFLELYSNKNLKVFYTALRLLFGDMIVTANYIKDKTSSIEKANAIDLMNNFSITFKILNIMKTFNTISQERGKKIVPIEIAYKVSNICNNPFKDYTVIELVAREFTLDKKSEIVKLNDESDIISLAILMGGKILSSFPLKTSNNLHACMLENRYDISIDNKLISAFKNNFEVIKRQLYITNLYFNQIKFNTMPLPPLPLPALPLLPPLPALPVLISRQQRSNTTSKPLPMLPSVSFKKVNNNRTINIKTRLST